MKIHIVEDPEIVRAVQDSIQNSPHKDYLDRVSNEILSQHTHYLRGGAPRDAIHRLLYGGSRTITDFDFLIDDSEEKVKPENLFNEEDNVTINKFGTATWRPRQDLNFRIAISTFSNANPILKGENHQPSLELSMTTCDFNTGSLAYCMNTRELWDYNGIKGLEKREIEMIYQLQSPFVYMTRMIGHAMKLGFNLGPKAKAFIQEHYTSDMNPKIIEYLEQHGNSEQSQPIIKRLETEAK